MKLTDEFVDILDALINNKPLEYKILGTWVEVLKFSDGHDIKEIIRRHRNYGDFSELRVKIEK